MLTSKHVKQTRMKRVVGREATQTFGMVYQMVFGPLFYAAGLFHSFHRALASRQLSFQNVDTLETDGFPDGSRQYYINM